MTQKGEWVKEGVWRATFVIRYTSKGQGGLQPLLQLLHTNFPLSSLVCPTQSCVYM